MAITIINSTAERLPQNLLTYSNSFENGVGGWVTSATRTADYTTGPSGNNDAILLDDDSAVAFEGAQKSGLTGFLMNSEYTFSIYIKKTTAATVFPGLTFVFSGGTSVRQDSTIDTNNGVTAVRSPSATYGGGTTSVEDAGAYWRVIMSINSGDNTTVKLDVYPAASNDVTGESTWNSNNQGSAVFFGAQLENYDSAGSYQPTFSSQVPGGNRVLTRLPQNLLLQSEDFSSATWADGSGGTTVTSNSVNNPVDGAATADTLTQIDSVNDCETQNAELTLGKKYTLSAYIKNVDATASRMRIHSNPGAAADADLFILWTAGVPSVQSATAACLDLRFTSLSDGWYRISFSFVADVTEASHLTRFYPEVTDTATQGIYIYGAQLEAYADGPGTYTATTTAAVPGVTITRASTATYFDHHGIMQTAAIGEDRTDYDPSDNSLRGLLIEEARTNICLYSEDFSTGWTASIMDVTANAAVAPDGATTADKLIPTTDNLHHRVYSNGGSITAANVVHSYYVKASGYTQIGIRESITTGASAVFDLSDGTVDGTHDAGALTVSATSIEDVGNGWYRISMTTTDSGTTAQRTGICILNGSWTSGDVISNTFAGDGTSGIFAWGAMSEAGSAPSSYIPTTTASVTRAADGIKISDLSAIGYDFSESSVFVKQEYGRDFIAGRYDSPFSFSDNTNANRIEQYRLSAGTLQRLMANASEGGIQVNDGRSISGNGPHLSAWAWADNDDGYSVNGGAAVNDTTCIAPAVVTRMYIGCGSLGYNQFLNGWIAQLDYYNKRLADDDLVTLSGTGTFLPGAVATADTIADALKIRLNDRGYTVGSIDDRMHQYFNAQGYAGSIQDQWRLHLDSLGYSSRDLQADMMEWLEDKRPVHLGDLSDVDDLSSLWLEYLTTYEDWLS